MGTHPFIDPVAFELGPLAVRWYGLMYVLALVVGWALLARRAGRGPHADWSSEQVADVVFYVALGAVVGGRLGYILFYDFSAYLAEPLAVFRVWQGGMSFHGGLIGAILAVVWLARRLGRPWLALTDFVAPAIALGLGFGRLGNFINGELWGAPTGLPWGMVFPQAGELARHPTQLYEALLEGLVLFAVLWWFSSRARPLGAVSGLFLLLYGLFRSLVELLREPDAHLGYLAFGWLTMGQVLCVPMLLGGVWLLARAGRRRGEDAA